MKQQITSPGVFTSEGDSNIVLRASLGLKGLQTPIPINQPTPILRRMTDPVLRIPDNTNKAPGEVQQGGVTPKKVDFTPQPEGVTPKPIGFTPEQGSITPKPIQTNIQQGGVVVKPFDFVPERTSPVIISPFGVFYHTSTVSVNLTEPVQPKIGVAVDRVDFQPEQGSTTPRQVDVVPQQGGTAPKLVGFTPNQGSTTVAIGQQDLSITNQVAVPARTRFRTSISLADRFNQPNLGSTTFLSQYVLSDQNTGYLRIRPTVEITQPAPTIGGFEQDAVEQGSTTPSLFDFEPNQGGVEPKPIGFTPEQGSTSPKPIGFTPEQGSTTPTPIGFTPEQGSTDPNPIGFTPEQGGTPSSTFTFEPTQGGVEIEPTTFFPTQGSTEVEPIVFEPEQGETTPVISEFEPQQGSTDPTPIGFTPTQGSTDVAPIDFSPNQGSTTPTPIGFTPEQGGVDPGQINFNPEQGGTTPPSFEFEPTRDAPVLNVLRYEADRLLALTLPRVKHGSETVIPFDFEPNRDTPQQPQTPAQGDISTQAEQLESGNTFISTGDVGTVGKYRTLAYGELQRAPRTNLNPVINTGTVVTQGVSDVSLDKDFVDLIINGIRFRAYITSFNDSMQVTWGDVQYIGRQDVMKTFKSVTRTVSIGFKTAAFTKGDLGEMYQKLSRLVNTSTLGRYPESTTYVVAPFSKLTIGKWFVESPCVINSIKFDTQPTEYSWDVGSTRKRSNGGFEQPPAPSPEGLSDEEADSRQLPMIVDVSIDLAMLGDASGNAWSGENDIFKLNG